MFVFCKAPSLLVLCMPNRRSISGASLFLSFSLSLTHKHTAVDTERPWTIFSYSWCGPLFLKRTWTRFYLYFSTQILELSENVCTLDRGTRVSKFVLGVIVIWGCTLHILGLFMALCSRLTIGSDNMVQRIVASMSEREGKWSNPCTIYISSPKTSQLLRHFSVSQSVVFFFTWKQILNTQNWLLMTFNYGGRQI